MSFETHQRRVDGDTYKGKIVQMPPAKALGMLERDCGSRSGISGAGKDDLFLNVRRRESSFSTVQETMGTLAAI